MGISRKRRVWAHAFNACVLSMSHKRIRKICRRNKDIFIMCGKKVKFTKGFLDGE